MAYSKKMSDLLRLLECPICLEHLRSPRLLPCLHTFCEVCISEHMAKKEDGGSFPCPLCNAKLAIPGEGVSGFKTNICLNEIVLLFSEGVDLLCAVCKTRNVDVRAASMCIQCSDHLCEACATSHCKSRITLDHRVVGLDEIRNGEHLEEIRRSQKIYCAIHKDKVLEIYCDSCEQAVCYLCSILEHSQHDMRNLHDTAKTSCDVLHGLLEPWREAAEHCDKACEQRDEIYNDVDQLEEGAEGNVNRIYDEFKDKILQEIETQRSASIGNLKEKAKAVRKQAKVACSEAELDRVTVKSTLNYATNIVVSGHDVEKVQQFRDIKARLEGLGPQSVKTQNEKPKFSFHPDQLLVPNVSLSVDVEMELEQISSKFSERYCKNPAPVIKEKAVRVNSFSTGMRFCNGLAVSDDRFVATSYLQQKVKVFDRGSFKLLFDVNQDHHKLQGPNGVTCNKQTGEIFITDLGIKGVVSYNARGHVMKVTPNLYVEDGYIGSCNDELVITSRTGGRLIVTDYDCNIKRVMTKSSLNLREFNPHYVCADNNGCLVVTECDHNRPSKFMYMYVIDNQSTIIHTYGALWTPHGVCADVWGNILVADNVNHRVVLFTNPEEEPRDIITKDDVSSPTGLAITAPGEVAVLEYEGDVKVFKYVDV